MRFLIFIFIIFLTSCSSSDRTPVTDGLTPMPGDHGYSDAYIKRMEAMCYARIQKTIGETRSGRGIIWAECMDEYVRPLEQKNYPDKSPEIVYMYQSLIKDMYAFYEGRTTLDLLHQRWAKRQMAIGYKTIRQYKDTY